MTPSPLGLCLIPLLSSLIFSIFPASLGLCAFRSGYSCRTWFLAVLSSILDPLTSRVRRLQPHLFRRLSFRAVVPLLTLRVLLHFAQSTHSSLSWLASLPETRMEPTVPSLSRLPRSRPSNSRPSLLRFAVLVVQKFFYGQDWSFAYKIMLVLSTQLIGFSLGGLLRRFLVWPAAMICEFRSSLALLFFR